MTPYQVLLSLSCREKERVPSVLDMIHYPKKARDTLDKLKEFLKENIYPVEMVRATLISVNFDCCIGS